MAHKAIERRRVQEAVTMRDCCHHCGMVVAVRRRHVPVQIGGWGIIDGGDWVDTDGVVGTSRWTVTIIMIRLVGGGRACGHAIVGRADDAQIMSRAEGRAARGQGGQFARVEPITGSWPRVGDHANTNTLVTASNVLRLVGFVFGLR